VDQTEKAIGLRSGIWAVRNAELMGCIEEVR